MQRYPRLREETERIITTYIRKQTQIIYIRTRVTTKYRVSHLYLLLFQQQQIVHFYTDRRSSTIPNKYVNVNRLFVVIIKKRLEGYSHLLPLYF